MPKQRILGGHILISSKMISSHTKKMSTVKYVFKILLKQVYVYRSLRTFNMCIMNFQNRSTICSSFKLVENNPLFREHFRSSVFLSSHLELYKNECWGTPLAGPFKYQLFSEFLSSIEVIYKYLTQRCTGLFLRRQS